MHGLPYSFDHVNAELVMLFKNQQSSYLGALPSNHEWRKISQAIPKFIWWKIWLARNDLIFNSEMLKLEIVAPKAKAFLLEAIRSHQIDGTKLEVEYKWFGSKQVNKFSCD